MSIVEVILWNQLVGVLVWNENTNTCSFEYSQDFIKGGLQLSPFINPLSKKIIHVKSDSQHTTNFRDIDFDTDKGLPLFISDSLPDKFGTDLFAKYLEIEGKNYRELNPAEKLTYIGNRGMGALEYRPANNPPTNNESLNLKNLNDLTVALLNNKPIATINDMTNLFHVGTSPGGAQPKVLINIDKETGDIFRGDNLPTEKQECWILKFNKDIGLESDIERGKIEYAYYLMARKSGINMMDSELKEIEGEHYFMTKRFDRIGGKKTHTQTLHALAGMNFKLPNTFSYEQIFSVVNKLNLDYSSKEQLFRTMVFNVMSRNVDDHTKNFGFNMDAVGVWRLSPAYDLTFTYNENFKAPTQHFLSINGKNTNHNLKDVMSVADEYGIKNSKKIINQINKSLLSWQKIAKELNVSKKTIEYIASKMKTMNYNLK